MISFHVIQENYVEFVTILPFIFGQQKSNIFAETKRWSFYKNYIEFVKIFTHFFLVNKSQKKTNSL